ncbi:RNase RNM [Candidatus Williamhamiltonella defendens]|uniref:RNase RNM n=1 Tax=Candidatus Williamhamiltonella defendens TaxID=138072 RepID=UPI0015830620|nr:PHP domain-containing protein [Candidatus Hamiltonella defensa]
MIEKKTSIIYDLHSHTSASDGLLTPMQLVHRAVTMGVHILAITDHDTTSGLMAAKKTIQEQQLPIQLIDGVEISTLWRKYEIHIVGLGIDINHPVIKAFLDKQSERRYERAQKISAAIEEIKIPNVWKGVQDLAGKGLVTRAHFARYLLNLGKGSNIKQIFKKYLVEGKPGYVLPEWGSIKEAIEIIKKAEGYAVLAHPARYGFSNRLLKVLLAYFADQGGDAMEVAQCQQATHERTLLAQYANEYHLLASQGSDFHHPCSWIELGRHLWLPAGSEPIWDHWNITVSQPSKMI